MPRSFDESATLTYNSVTSEMQAQVVVETVTGI